MSVEAVCLHDHQRRTFARTRAIDRLLRRTVNGDDVVAVDRGPWHAIGDGSRREIPDRGRPAHRCVLRELVVLAREHDGQLHYPCQVHRLVEGSLVDAAVTEEAHRDLARLAELDRDPGAGGEPETTAHDSV